MLMERLAGRDAGQLVEMSFAAASAAVRLGTARLAAPEENVMSDTSREHDDDAEDEDGEGQPETQGPAQEEPAQPEQQGAEPAPKAPEPPRAAPKKPLAPPSRYSPKRGPAGKRKR